jgi:hypothetical protein
MRVRNLQVADVPAVAALFTETVRSVNVRDYTPEQVEVWAPRPPDVAAWERSFFTADASITALPFFERRGYETVARQEKVLRGVRFTNYRVRKPLDQYPRVVL